MSRATNVSLLVLPLFGFGISTYLWSAKAGGLTLVCTEFSDCAGVNASAYSEIAGVPVAAAGAVMYALLTWAAVAWFRRNASTGGGASGHRPSGFRSWRRRWRAFLPSMSFALSLAGALFSLYLTAIEAFVLRAYCIWCLISWVTITVLALLWARVFLQPPSVQSAL